MPLQIDSRKNISRVMNKQKFLHVHAKIKAITFHIDIKEIHGLIFSHPLTCLGCY